MDHTPLPPLAANADPITAEASNGRQRYAAFAVELVLDKDNHVRGTRIVNTPDGQEDAWAGWDETRLLKFIAQYAALTPRPAAPATRLTGKLHLRELQIVSSGANGLRNVLHRGQPFDVRLSLDLTEVVAPSEVILGYTATIYARSLGDGSHQLVGEACGNFTPTDNLAITISGMAPPPGVYRLAAAITLSVMPMEPDLSVLLEGSLLQFH